MYIYRTGVGYLRCLSYVGKGNARACVPMIDRKNRHLRLFLFVSRNQPKLKPSDFWGVLSDKQKIQYYEKIFLQPFGTYGSNVRVSHPHCLRR